MKCPNCGHTPTLGRPKRLDDKKVFKLAAAGLSLSDLAAKFKVTRGAIQASLKRAKIA